MMHAVALLAASTLAQPPLRVSVNNFALPVISSVDAGASLWGGDVVIKSTPPPVLAGSTIFRTSTVRASPAGSAFRVTCATPPCDIYVAVYHNRCAGETEQFGLFRQLSTAGWNTNPCSLVGQKTADGTDIRLPIKHKRVNDVVTEFNLAEDSSRVVVFVRVVDPNVALGNVCPPKPAGPFPPENLQLCPGLAALPVNAVRPSLGSRVLQIEQDGVFVGHVNPIIGAGNVQDVVSIDQWGNVISGFEVAQRSVLTFYQKAGTDTISLIWVSDKDDRATRLGDQHKVSTFISGLPSSALNFATDSVYATSTYEAGVHKFVADFPIERSVGAVYTLPDDLNNDVVCSVGPFELTNGLRIRDGSSSDVIPIRTDIPFKIVTTWL